MSNIQTTTRILNHYGISLCEHYVLCSVNYRICADQDELARHSHWATEGDQRGDFPLSDHIAAVKSCIAKGWLTILTEQDCQGEVERMRSSNIPEIYDLGLREGVVDFTYEGYLRYREILKSIERVQRNYSGWYIDDSKCFFDIYAETEQDCLGRLDEMKSDFSNYVGAPAFIRHIEGPYKIGQWKPIRFITIVSGFHVRVHYQIINEQ